MFVLSTFISLAMICACQRQDSTAEAQLAQRKAELDTREKALTEREKALAEKEKMSARFRAIPSDLQARKQAVDPEQEQKRKERREYNSFLPSFRPSFATARYWIREQLKKAGAQKTDPQNYSVVSRRRAERRWAQ